jgi:hypothetical protein
MLKRRANHDGGTGVIGDLWSALVARLSASEPSEDLPTAETVIKAIALAKGKLRGHEYFLTKTEMIGICEQWLAEKMLKRRARSPMR